LPAWGRRLCARLIREPLFRFMLIGALIFVAAHVAQARRTQASHRIVIGPQVVRRLVAVSQMQDGITPGPRQLALLENQYTEDEALYREALARGLGRDDEIVRRRLVQKMRYIEHDLAVPPLPSEQLLRGYYADHAALFTSPASAAFEQIYFSPDRGGWADARGRALRARHRLARAGETDAGSWGSSLARLQDDFPGETPEGELTRVDAQRLFGATGIVDALFQAQVGQWSQPIRSGYGWHLVKVIRRSPPRLAPFNEVRGEVLADWTQEEAQRRERAELQALRGRYEVVRLGSADGVAE
jgi:hypothetical protein